MLNFKNLIRNHSLSLISCKFIELLLFRGGKFWYEYLDILQIECINEWILENHIITALLLYMESMEQRFKLYMKYVEALYHGKLIIKIILSIPLKIFIETDRKK